MNFFKKNKNKILLPNFIFLILIIFILLELLVFIGDNLWNILETSNSNITIQFQTIVLIVSNAAILIFFTLYLYLANKKIKIGIFFVIFWSFVWIFNIIGIWVLGQSSLTIKIIRTFINIAILGALLYLYILISQNNFYVNNLGEW